MQTQHKTNKFKTIFGIFAIISSSVAMAPVALAQNDTDYHTYVGFVAGQASQKAGFTEVKGAKHDRTDKAGYVYLGVQMHHNIGAEVFIASLGKAKLTAKTGDSYKLNAVAETLENDAKLTATTRSYGAAFRLQHGISDKASGFLRVGFHEWSRRYKIVDDEGTDRMKKSGTDALLGVGMSFKVNENTAITAGYDHFKTGKDDVRLTSIGLQTRLR